MENLIISSSPHVKSQRTTHFFMQDVILALMPVLIAGVVFFSYRALVLVLISVISCVFFEGLYSKLLNKPSTLKDYSAVVTGLILGLNLSVGVPIYFPIIGAAFAIIVVKMIFGGLGKNIVNPAAAARVFLSICFTKSMTTWVAPVTAIGENAGSLSLFGNVDVVSSATPLTYLKDAHQISSLMMHYSITDLFIGSVGGCIGETCSILLLLGGLFLLVRKVITWHIPVSFVGTVAVLTFLFPQYTTISRIDFMSYHLLSGGLLFGAIYMATDFTTSPTTRLGRVIYGCGCGLITVIIRYFGAYPEGVSFAILIMNFFAWQIDQYTLPKKFGGEKRGFIFRKKTTK